MKKLFNFKLTPVEIILIVAVLYFVIPVIAGMFGSQSRFKSRITGQPLPLQLPSDFKEPVSFSTGKNGDKDLFYISKDGVYKVKTYTVSGKLESEIVFKK